MKKRVYLSSPHLTGNEQKYIDEAIQTNWIAPLGPHVDAFEKELADYVDVKGAVALSSGTAAIHLALAILGTGKGDTVFCSSLTFVASANPIRYVGAVPVFIDSEEETWNMSPQALLRAMKDAKNQNKIPKAVIVVNLYGQSAKMDELLEICDFYGVPMIEDAAESLGATYKGRKSGTFGHFGIFSFNGNKIITTSGGGMLVSNHLEDLAKAKFLATQARDHARHYQHSQMGFNYRLSNLLAGVGRAQLEVIDQRVAARRGVFQKYKQSLQHLKGIQFMPEYENSFSNRWLTTFTLNPKETIVTPIALIEALEDDNIEARPVWKPLHLQPLFKDCLFYSHLTDDIVSERLFAEGICLPSGSNITTEEQNRVISIIERMYSNSLVVS